MAKFRNLMADPDPDNGPEDDPKTGHMASGRAGDGSGKAPDDTKSGRAKEPNDQNPPADLPHEAASVPALNEDRFKELAQPCEETVVLTDGSAPYNGFASKRSKTWESLLQLHSKIKEGTPFIGFPGGQFELADPLRLYLVRFKQFWSERDDQYNIQRVQFSDPGRRSELTEEFLALCVVHLEQGLVPTVSYFGGTKSGAVRRAADTLRLAGSADWAKLSPAHEASARCRLPFGRFVNEVTIEPRTSKETGRAYSLAVGHVRPTNLKELTALDRAINDDDFWQQLQLALGVFDSRLRNLEELADEIDAA
jgi:hypothetical protein